MTKDNILLPTEIRADIFRSFASEVDAFGNYG